MHWCFHWERERERERDKEMERERERSTSSHFASHTGAQSRLAFPARERSAPSYIANKPSCLSQKSSLTQLNLCRRLERVSTTPRRRRDKKVHDCMAARATNSLHRLAGGAGQHPREREKGRRRRRHGGKPARRVHGGRCGAAA